MSLLTVTGLTHGFGDRAIFNNVSFQLNRLDKIGLVGANGEGKSTFMNIITGKLMPDEGKVEWAKNVSCLLYTSPSPRDRQKSRMPSSA